MCVVCCVCFFFLFSFFFQAEDGIRDLVRSRGLGDVYKRQGDQITTVSAGQVGRTGLGHAIVKGVDDLVAGSRIIPVSYTHLTLPTSDLV
mgnify:CR=1 FL=1